LDRPLRVHFIHGLESSPQGEKARFFAAHFDAVTPSMDTRDLEGAIRTQALAIRTAIEAGRGPDVVVGSSFGGAIAVALLARGLWRGPTLLLAQAAQKLGVVDPLTRTGTLGLVTLEEVDDEHRLSSLVASGRLAELVRELHARATRSA
jgi:pimeloyl-ACP methyl ester carboxylesterase